MVCGPIDQKVFKNIHPLSGMIYGKFDFSVHREISEDLISGYSI